MARYEDEFAGIRARFSATSGADPNYREGYGGMRMWGTHGRAAYGAHRLGHLEDMGGSDGWSGIHPGVPPRDFGGYAAAMRQRGGSRPFRDREFLREYNANSPALHDGRYAADFRPARRDREPRDWELDGRFRPGYSNRGMSDGGYSDSWGRGPIRGGR